MIVEHGRFFYEKTMVECFIQRLKHLKIETLSPKKYLCPLVKLLLFVNNLSLAISLY